MRQFLCLLLLCSTGMLHAQTILTGTVTDKASGHPLEGVSVNLNNTGVHTNANGHYRIIVPAKGTYTIQTSYLGYKTISTVVNATENNTRTDITLEETGLFVKPVEITSLRAGEHAPFTQSTLSTEDIKKQNLGQDLPLLLNQQPGVVTNSDAGTGIGYTGIRVRGSDITRINVTANGIPINDAESQG